MVLSVFADDVISHLTHEINNWITVDEKSEEFQRLIHNLSLPTNLLRKDWRSFDGESSENICIICKSVLNTFIEYRRQGMSAEDIKSKVIKICTLLKLQSPQVCDGVVTINLVSVR